MQIGDPRIKGQLVLHYPVRTRTYHSCQTMSTQMAQLVVIEIQKEDEDSELTPGKQLSLPWPGRGGHVKYWIAVLTDPKPM